MQKLLAILCLVLCLSMQAADAQNQKAIPPTVEKVRLQAFKGLKQRIDVRQYASQDPNYLENSMALESGKNKVKNRTLLLKDIPAPMARYMGIGGAGMLYQVRPDGSNTSYLYVRDGSLFLVYIVSGKTYPTTTYVYNFADANGQLQAFSVNVSAKESYFFDRTGQFVSHCQGATCEDIPTRY